MVAIEYKLGQHCHSDMANLLLLLSNIATKLRINLSLIVSHSNDFLFFKSHIYFMFEIIIGVFVHVLATSTLLVPNGYCYNLLNFRVMVKILSS